MKSSWTYCAWPWMAVACILLGSRYVTHQLKSSIAYPHIGTGKTHLLSHIQQALFYKHGYHPRVALTASTGMAALAIQGMLFRAILSTPLTRSCAGQTLHSWAGFHNQFMSVQNAVEKVNRCSAVQCRWIEAEVLLIDERRHFSCR